jgi:hypothetical protein
MGSGFSGAKLWTEKEVAIAKKLYPDYQAISKEIGRSYYAARNKCRKLGLPPKHHMWTGAEITRLRKMYPTATKEELIDAFHGFSYSHIKAIASNHGFLRVRRPFKATGHPILDQIRARSFALGYSMPDIDKLSRTKLYFTEQQWRFSKSLNHKAVARAIAALDGKVKAQWNE